MSRRRRRRSARRGTLTRRLALDHASRDVASFVRLEGPDEVAVIVPNELHFGDVEHLDYAAPVQDPLAVQSSESPVNRAPSAHANFAGLGAEGKDGSGPGPGRRCLGSAAPPSGLARHHAHRPRHGSRLRGAHQHPGVGFGNTGWETNQLRAQPSPLAAGAVWVILSVLFTTMAAFITVYYGPQAASTGIPGRRRFSTGRDIGRVVAGVLVKATGICMVIAAGAGHVSRGPMVHIGAMVASYVVQVLEHLGLLRGSNRSHLLRTWWRAAWRAASAPRSTRPSAASSSSWRISPRGGSWTPISSYSAYPVFSAKSWWLGRTHRRGRRTAAEVEAISASFISAITSSSAPNQVPASIELERGTSRTSPCACSARDEHRRAALLLHGGGGDGDREGEASRVGAPRHRPEGRVSHLRGCGGGVPRRLVSVLAIVLPLLFSCRVRQDHVKGQPGASHITGEQHQVDHRMFVRFTCQQGQYNDMASLLLPSLSGSFSSTLSHLYSRDSDEGTYSDMPGARDPRGVLLLFPALHHRVFLPLFGLFVPNLVFGALQVDAVGGWRTEARGSGTSRVAHPTVYAVLGAGAALGGWTRMAIAISAIMLEQTGNMDSVILMMVTVLSLASFRAGTCSPSVLHGRSDQAEGVPGVGAARAPHHVSTHRGRRVHPRRRRAPSGRGRRVHRSRAGCTPRTPRFPVCSPGPRSESRPNPCGACARAVTRGAGTPRSGVAFDPPRHLTGDGPRAKTGRARIGAPSRPGVRARRSRESRAARRDGRRRRPRNSSPRTRPRRACTARSR